MANEDRERSKGDAARKEDAGSGDEEDELRGRFPDLDTDARLKTPRGDALPQVPPVHFERPAPQREPPKGRGFFGDLRGMGVASTIGIMLVASIAIGTGLGWLVDKYLLGSPTTPWGLIVGFLLGTASGFVNLVRVTNELNKDSDR